LHPALILLIILVINLEKGYFKRPYENSIRGKYSFEFREALQHEINLKVLKWKNKKS
jgi:hypothetical protein